MKKLLSSLMAVAIIINMFLFNGVNVFAVTAPEDVGLSNEIQTYSSGNPVKPEITEVKPNENGFDVTVSKVEDVTGYQVRYATWDSFENGKTDTFEGTQETTFTISGRAYGTKYYVQARTYITVDGQYYYSDWTDSEQVTTVSMYPDAISISSVKTNGNGFDVTVTKASNATGYQVRYATWDNFGNSKTDTFAGTDKTTFTITGRAYGTKYYVQARTYKTIDDKTYYSDWTEDEQVTTASVYPDETSISSVKANENGFDVTVTKVANITGYQIRYATWDNFGNSKTDTFEGTDKTTFTITGRAYGTKYYVQARTYRTVGGQNYYSDWTDDEQVTTVSMYPDEISISSVKANENGFDVTVTKASNATGYQVRYATWENFGNAKTDTFAGTDKTTFTITGRAYGTKYYVQARTYKTIGDQTYYSDWTDDEQVTTVSMYPDKVSISSVKAKENGFDVTVTKASNATGYQVRYATWDNFGNAKTDTFVGTDKTTFTITGRSYDAKYYVQARTYKTIGGQNYYSDWSASKQVNTASRYPDKISISSVRANGNGFDVTVTKASNATGYQVRYATWSNFGNSKTDTFTGTDKNTLTVTGRAYDATYYVQVRAYKTISGQNYYSDWSASKTVKTAQYPECPSPTAITGLKANENGFDVTVSKVEDATGYQVRYATWENFGNAKTDTFPGADKTTVTITGRAYDAKYYVQARTYKTVNGVNYYSDWTVAKQVTTVSIYPDEISISSVKADGNTFDVTVTKATNATGYQVRYATWENFGNAKTDTYEGTDETTLTVTGRSYDAKYYVQVRTYKTVSGQNYYSDWSASKSVTTDKNPNCPAETSITKVTGIVNGFDVSWNAVSNVSGYEIQYATKSDFSNGASQTADGSATTKTITGRAGGAKYYVRIRVFNTVDGVNYYSDWSAAKTVNTISSYADDLKKAGFPDSYIPALVELHEKYPNWIFKPFKTGLDWNTAVKGERSHGSNNPHSQQLIEYWSGNHNKGYYCTCSSCYKNGKYVTYEGGGWVAASQSAVEYYMDPRNFLNEKEIFQFESSEYNGTQTQAGVEAILNGTWMHEAKISYKDSSGNTKTINKTYSQVIIEASNKSGLSAYYLASKIRQEVGGATATAGGASGTVSGYKGIYNYYNINAYTGANDGLKWASVSSGYYTNCECRVRQSATTNSAELVMLPNETKVTVKSETSKQSDGYTWYQVSVTYGGKTYNGYIRSDLVDYLSGSNISYGRPWTDPEKSIINGAMWIANNYKNQPTGYLQKFNVNPASGSLYTHEYMANVQAAAAEAKSTYNAYKAANIVGMTKTFSIPVFNNMP